MQNNGIRAIISANQHLWLKITPPVRVSCVGRRALGRGRRVLSGRDAGSVRRRAVGVAPANPVARFV